MSSRQKLKAINDIFDMIADNDEDIRFDDWGILKPVTVSKSTTVVVRADMSLPCALTHEHRASLVSSPPMIILIRRRSTRRPYATLTVRLSLHRPCVCVCVYTRCFLSA
jgi:hypothetical protein